MGQGVLVLTCLALSGYTFLSRNLVTKYRIYKYQGHLLVYKCFYVGFMFLLASTLLFLIAWPLAKKSSFVFDIAKVVFPKITQSDFNLYSILLTTLILSKLCASLFNRLIRFVYFIYRNKELAKEQSESTGMTIHGQEQHDEKYEIPKKKTDNEIDIHMYWLSTDNLFISHIISALKTPSMLLFTLSSGKCYVCIPLRIDAPQDNEEQKEIDFIPVASGFRHGDDQCFEITTYYSEVIRILRIPSAEKSSFTKSELELLKKNLSSYKTTIPLSQIVSISNFDISKYLGFKLQENQRRDEIQRGRDNGKEPVQEKSIN